MEKAESGSLGGALAVEAVPPNLVCLSSRPAVKTAAWGECRSLSPLAALVPETDREPAVSWIRG